MSKAKEFYDNFKDWNQIDIEKETVMIQIDDIIKLMEEYAQSKTVSNEDQRKQMVDFYLKTCNKTISIEYAQGVVGEYLSNPIKEQ
jgi:hypothetical protein